MTSDLHSSPVFALDSYGLIHSIIYLFMFNDAVQIYENE